jgi:hypothetical protein
VFQAGQCGAEFHDIALLSAIDVLSNLVSLEDKIAGSITTSAGYCFTYAQLFSQTPAQEGGNLVRQVVLEHEQLTSFSLDRSA